MDILFYIIAYYLLTWIIRNAVAANIQTANILWSKCFFLHVTPLKHSHLLLNLKPTDSCYTSVSVHWVCLFWIERPSTENLFLTLSLIIRNITEISQRQQMDRETTPSSPDAIGLRPVKRYLKLPALGFLQQLMKSLHRAYIPGIMNSFWLMLLTKVYSCIQNISISSVGLGTDAKPGAPAGRYRQESI